MYVPIQEHKNDTHKFWLVQSLDSLKFFRQNKEPSSGEESGYWDDGERLSTVHVDTIFTWGWYLILSKGVVMKTLGRGQVFSTPETATSILLLTRGFYMSFYCLSSKLWKSCFQNCGNNQQFHRKISKPFKTRIVHGRQNIVYSILWN